MNCHTVRRFLNDKNAGEISASERIDIDEHLASCESCRSEWDVHLELAGREVPTTPDDLLQSICRSIDNDVASPEVSSRLRSPLVIGGLLVLGAAAATTAVWQLGKQVDEPGARIEPTISTSTQRPRSALEAGPQKQVPDGSADQQREAVPFAVSSPDKYSLDARSIVVLPLENRVTSADYAGLSDDVNEQILYRLALISGLNVISGATVAPYRKSNTPAEDIARLFGAGSILVGSIRETDPELIIIVTRIDAQTGKTMFGMGSTSRKRNRVIDSSDLAERIAHRVAEAVAKERVVHARPQQFAMNAQARFLDTDLSDSERVQALGSLRYAEGNARSGAVATSAVEMAQNSSDPSLRRQVWQYMRGVGDPYLIQPLLQSLAYDTSQAVRKEAAKTLEDFVGETGVREALEYAIVHDESQSVRDRAHFTLASEQEREAIITGIVLNTGLTDRERLAPLWEQCCENRDELVLSNEAITALMEMSVSSDDPRIRGSVWRHLRGIDNPDLVSPLLHQLANDPDEHARESAASLLGEYLDYAGVRSALEEAAVNETSRSVRRAARSSLGQIDQ